jgi:hypothetical protein
LDKGQRGDIVKLITSLSTPFIAKLIACIPVRPTPLFHDDVNSTNSADNHDDDTVAVEEILATQGPEALDEVENLTPSLGLMDPEGYVNMREPWVKGLRSEKVCRCEL